MSNEQLCGCKGIRTCLLCEKEKRVSVPSVQSEEAEYIYTYCHHCNLCWSDDEDSAPLYLGKLNLFPDFLSEEEQHYAMSDVDSIPWMPSQSGRRKQDFGPKVNFKKKKVKIGEFRGFPKFTGYIIQRIQDAPGLGDFRPVELCHLEYSPERGSSIDPHVDDCWLWGERLVTVNLGSSTVLTLAPCSDGPCKCHREPHYFPHMCTSMDGRYENDSSLDHKFRTASSTERFLKSLSIADSTACNDGEDIDNINSTQNSEGNTCLNGHEKWILRNYQCTAADTIPKDSSFQSESSTCHPTGCRNVTERTIKTMCSLYRKGDSESKVTVRIVMPPRSLFVLAGCARYNWSHEIKRRDVVSRRLAMTFRELTPQFLDGGKESQFGKDLLLIANNFIDL